MAVVATVTVTHVTFPTLGQFKTLEPDGLAIARLASTGDGSGGNILHTFRGQQGFFYILRAISAEMDEDGAANDSPDVEVRLDAQWLADRAGLSQGDLYAVLSMANVGPDGGTPRRVAGGSFIRSLLDMAGHLPLGRVGGAGVFDILSMSHRKNVLTNEYVSLVLFDAYRQEALTVPGILGILRQGLFR